MYLTLPLPSSVTRTMTVTVFYGDRSGLLTPFTVTVLKHGCCKDLTQTLGAACCLRADECLLLAEVNWSSFSVASFINKESVYIHGCVHVFLNFVLGIILQICSLVKVLHFQFQVYEHRIYRYLDNSLDLSSIKDEDYIVAYRLPKVGAGRTKVEITHRWLERWGFLILTQCIGAMEDYCLVKSAIMPVWHSRVATCMVNVLGGPQT